MTPSPYTPPGSELNSTISAPGSLTRIERIAPNRGWFWFFDGFRRLFAAPGRWTLIGILNLLITLVLSFIPILNTILPYLFYPVIIAGFMQAAANQDRQQLSVIDLFSGFNNQTGALFIAGLLYLVMMIVIFIVTSVVIFLIGMSAFAIDGNISLSSLLAMPGLMFVLSGLVFLALMLPAIMALWFTPALIILNGFSAINAIKTSFRACWLNFMPYLIYSLAALLILVLPALLLYALTGSNENGGNVSTFGLPLSLSFWLSFMLYTVAIMIWFIPALLNSVYRSYLDIFPELQLTSATQESSKQHSSS